MYCPIHSLKINRGEQSTDMELIMTAINNKNETEKAKSGIKTGTAILVLAEPAMIRQGMQAT